MIIIRMAEEESDTIFSEEEWGGTGNEIMIPPANIIAALLGLSAAPPLDNPFTIHPVSPPLPPSPSPPRLAGQVRRRDEQHPMATVKALREAGGDKVLIESLAPNRYVKLASGEEMFFTEEDGKKLLLNSFSEPDELVRNIISNAPPNIIDRLEYLAKFQQPPEAPANQEDLKDKVCAAYIKEWRLRFLFRKLLIRWRVTKMNKSAEKDVDPITLVEPEKEVHVYDWSNKRKFIFDARSLATLIETKLLYQEYGFPIPQAPKNPKNNVEFTYGQLISIYNQCQEQGELRWGLTTLRQYNFNKSRWHLYHKSALTMNSIKTSISTLDTFEARELFSDFIFAKMDELGYKYSNYVFNAYQVAMTIVPKHWYLEKLKSWACLHYEAEHFGHNKTRTINAACLRIFKKHPQFMADLKAKNVI
jgi:hypothetical protein